MKKINSHCWLAIATCLCVIVCLGYVNLFRGLTAKVSNPGSSEFWQLRTVALKVRDAKAEAMSAYLQGDLQPFDDAALVSHMEHWTAESYQSSEEKKASPFRFASFQVRSTAEPGSHAHKLSASHLAYQEAVHDFSIAYNAELTRLINE